MKIFLSVGATYNEQQEQFVSAFETFLGQNGCEKLTVGRGNFRADQPIFAARELMQSADAVIVIAFTRFVVERGKEKPESDEESAIEKRRYPTVWNQLEAAMAFGLHLPMLVIVERGLHQEAMLKDRLEFQVIITDLDSTIFDKEEFRGKFKDWKTRSLKKDRRKRPLKDLEGLTVGEIIQDLRPGQLWKAGAAVIGLLAAVATFAFWLGQALS